MNGEEDKVVLMLKVCAIGVIVNHAGGWGEGEGLGKGNSTLKNL